MGTLVFFGETVFTIGFAHSMFPIRCTTFAELRLQKIGDFYEKPHFTIQNFKFYKVRNRLLKTVEPKY